MKPEDKIKLILVHIDNVQRNCDKLGLKLIQLNNVELGRNIIANGRIHDNSKLRGFEFEQLFKDEPLLREAIQHHQSTNPHHPEYWRGIKEMPYVYLAEMVCDCTARAQEFGQDARKWLNEEATKRYGFTEKDNCYTHINYFLDLLLEPGF